MPGVEKFHFFLEWVKISMNRETYNKHHLSMCWQFNWWVLGDETKSSGIAKEVEDITKYIGLIIV